MTKFFEYLNEAGLSGKSRSGGVSNWDFYLVKNFNIRNEFLIDKDCDLLDRNFKIIGKLKKDDEIIVKSMDLLNKGKSKFTEILIKDKKQTGYINISNIKKPSNIKNGIIGNVNSKEFTPNKLGLVNLDFNNKKNLIDVLILNLNNIYKNPKYSNIKKYLYDVIRLVSSSNIICEEIFKKSYSLKNQYEISENDIKILSKNFGEVISALYIISNSKNIKILRFPDIKQGLYDFLTVDKNDRINYFSVKSRGGSSTSLENLNFLIKNFSKGNSFFEKYNKEIKIITDLINDKDNNKTTIFNIEKFFTEVLFDKKNEIIKELNRISKNIKIKDLSQNSLNKWFDDITTNSSEDMFIKIMNNIYSNILGDLKGKSSTDIKVLKYMYSELKDSSKVHNGYIYYPMGSYIVKYLNNVGDYLKVLNELLNFGTFIKQISVNLSMNDIIISIEKFKTSTFKFSYNSMSKSPGNRPIGFTKN